MAIPRLTHRGAVATIGGIGALVLSIGNPSCQVRDLNPYHVIEKLEYAPLTLGEILYTTTYAAALGCLVGAGYLALRGQLTERRRR